MNPSRDLLARILAAIDELVAIEEELVEALDPEPVLPVDDPEPELPFDTVARAA